MQPDPTSSQEKGNLHPRNKHRLRYNFPQLINAFPELEKYVLKNQYQDLSIDFKDAVAVKMLNKALLIHFYKLKYWDIPDQYLCPPIPGRADYIHYVADLLATDHSEIPSGKFIRVLDIGVGANCIYPLIGHQEYGWSFVGSDVDVKAIKSARDIVEANRLSKHIILRKQNSSDDIFTGLIGAGDRFDLTICNPPFHSSLNEATAGTERKWKNLNKMTKGDTVLNFGGKNNELWTAGGEKGFLKKMITESTRFAGSCLWFTSLISKKETLKGCYIALSKAGAFDVKTIDMAQGQKVSRILAWTFHDSSAQQLWRARRWHR
jgi:23S rRNA (adenine1618-N6)-methyltransferase